MQVSYFRLVIFVILILVFQLIINSATTLYFDCLTLLLIAMLLEGVSGVRLLIIICLLADLFGHWYFGTHLLAITLISFFTNWFSRFYRMCDILQKIVLNALFSFFTYIIISLITLVVHNFNINWIDLLIEVLLINPIILLILNKFIITLSPDIIRTE